MYFLTPTLPFYILRIGGQESDVGLLLGAFTLTAIAARPWVGQEIDRRQRRIFLLIGACVYVAASLLYDWARSVPALLALRAFHGLGIAAFTTASGTLVADLAPPTRRGEAMGIYGMSANIALALAPAAGLALMRAFDFPILFSASAGMAILSLALCLGLREPRRASAPPTSSNTRLISRSALLPSSIIMCAAMTYGATLSFLPLLAQARRIEGFEVFFTVYAATLIFVRAWSGKLSDRFGRGVVLIPGLLLLTLAMEGLAITPSWLLLVGVGMLYGFGFGSVHPTLLALTVDRAGAEERGAAMATFGLAFDLGIGLGSVVFGYVLQATDFTLTYAVVGSVTLIGLAVFVMNGRR